MEKLSWVSQRDRSQNETFFKAIKILILLFLPQVHTQLKQSGRFRNLQVAIETLDLCHLRGLYNISIFVIFASGNRP